MTTINNNISSILSKRKNAYSSETFTKFTCSLFQSFTKSINSKEDAISIDFLEPFLFSSKFIATKLISTVNRKGTNLTQEQFTSLLMKMYQSSMKEFETFLFDFLDFDHDGKINMKDILLLCYHFHYMSNSDFENKNNFDSITQILNEVNASFFNEKETLSFSEYQSKLMKDNSDLLYIFIAFFKANSPFTKEQILFYRYFVLGNKHNETNNKDNWYSVNYIEPSSSLVEYLNKFQNFKLTEIDETVDELTAFEDDFISLKNSCCNESSSSLLYENCTTQYTSYLIDSKKEIAYSEEELNEFKTEGDVTVNNVIKYNQCVLYFIHNTLFLFDMSNNCLLDIFLIENILNISKSSSNDKSIHTVTISTNTLNCIITVFSLNSMMNLFDFLSGKSNPIENSYNFNENEVITQGSFGEIFEATSKRSKETVYIKKISRKESREQWEVQICKLLKNISHNSIIRIYDVFESLNEVYIVMQKGGESLKSYIANLNLSFDEVLTISSQIANGLKCLHSLGIIHRDIKLENIVHTSNEFRLIDFGLSTIISSSESTLDSYGTITYMSPEIIKKEKYNNKADIWSFGVVVYILLKKRLPFCENCNNEIGLCDSTHTSTLDIVYNILNRAINLKNESNTKKEKTLANIVNTCLEKTSEKREEINVICDWISECI